MSRNSVVIRLRNAPEPAQVAVRGSLVAIVFAGSAALDLQRRMVDAEAMVEIVSGR